MYSKQIKQHIIRKFKSRLRSAFKLFGSPIVFAALIALSITSCKQLEVDRIYIGMAMYESQSYGNNKDLQKLIKQSLQKDQSAFAALCRFRCLGQGSCNDLGFIVTQIIHRVGEQEAIKMSGTLTSEESKRLIELVALGLMNGDQDNDGVPDQKEFAQTFPTLYTNLQEK